MSPARYLIAAGTSRYVHLAEEQQLPRVAHHVDAMIDLFGGRLGYELVLPELRVDPSDQQLRTSLGEWCTDPARRDTDIVVFYYSGHGAYSSDRAHFLLTANSKERNLEGTAVKTDQLPRLMLADTPLKRLLIILDTCHAGMGTHDIARMAISLDASGSTEFDLIAATAPKDFTFEERFVTAFIAAMDDEQYGGNRQQWLDPRAIVHAINEQWRERGIQQRARYVSSGAMLPEFIPNPRYAAEAGRVAVVAAGAPAPAAIEEIEAHWDPRARGVQRAYEEGSYFTGRVAALRELVAWMSSPAGDGRVRIVTGAPGSGKSAVLARLVMMSDPTLRAQAGPVGAEPDTLPPVGAVTAAVHAKGKTPIDIVARIARAIGVTAATPGELRQALQARAGSVVIVVDALDEAADPKAVADDVLGALASLPSVRLLVGTRAEYVARLGERPVVIDLDASGYADEGDVAEFVRRQLLDERTPSPYLGHHDLAKLVAGAVAGRAHPLFLVARLTAQALVNAGVLVDVTQPDWSVRFPASVGGAFDDFLERFGSDERRVRDLLMPLAYAEGAGLPWENIWAPLASALSGAPCTNEDIRWLKSRAGAFIVSEAVEEGRSVYRLFHQALAEHLRRPADDEPTVQQAIVRVLTGLGPVSGEEKRIDWFGAPAYVRRHLMVHAAQARDTSLDRLVCDPGFAIAANAERLLGALPRVTSTEARDAARVYRQAAHYLRNSPPAEAAAYVAMIAEQHALPDVATSVAELPLKRPWTARWALWGSSAPHQVLTQGGEVQEVGLTQAQGRAAILVRGYYPHEYVLRDLLSGGAIGPPLDPIDPVLGALPVAFHRSAPLALMVSRLDDQHWELRAVDLSMRQTIAAISIKTKATPRRTALAPVGGRDVVAAWFDDGTLKAWDLGTGTILFTAVVDERSVERIDLVDAGSLSVLACLGWDWARAWRLADGLPAGPSVRHEGFPAENVAFAAVGDRILLACGHPAGLVVLADLVSGTALNRTFEVKEGSVVAVTTATLNGRSCLAASGGNWNSALRVWDLETGDLVAGPLSGHTDCVRTIAMGEVNGRPVLVSGGRDRTVRVWELDAGSARSRKPADIGGGIAIAQRAGRPVVLAGAVDGKTYVFDSETGEQAMPPLYGHAKGVAAVATATVGGATLMVTSGWDETIRAWHLETGMPAGDPWTGHTHWVRALDTGTITGSPVAVSGSDDGTIRVWELPTGALLRNIKVRRDGVEQVAIVGVDDQEAVAVLGSDGTLGVWSLRTGALLRKPLEIQGERIERFALTEMDGHLTAMFLQNEGVFHCRLDRNPLEARLLDHALGWYFGYSATAKAVTILTLGGRHVVAAAHRDWHVRLWSIDGKLLGAINVDADVYALIPTGESGLIVSCSKGLMRLDLDFV